MLKKGKRLLAPFFILGTVICLTSYSDDSAKMGFKWMVYGCGSHLWYCIMLFWVNIVAWFLLKNKMKVLNVIVFLLSLASPIWFDFLGISVLPWGWHKSIQYYSHFIIGVWIFEYICSHRINYRHTLLYFAIAYFAIFLLIKISNTMYLHVFLYTLKSICFYCLLFSLINVLIEWRLIKENSIVHNIAQYSFGIYVIHHWIGWNLYHTDISIKFMENYYIPFAFFNTVWIFIASYYITKFSLRSKIGQVLLT